MHILNRLKQETQSANIEIPHVVYQSMNNNNNKTTKNNCKHKYWNKVSKKNKLQLLMDYINRTYNDNTLKMEYSFKITMLLNNGDLNENDCVEFDYINNRITKLNFSLETLQKE